MQVKVLSKDYVGYADHLFARWQANDPDVYSLICTNLSASFAAVSPLTTEITPSVYLRGTLFRKVISFVEVFQFPRSLSLLGLLRFSRSVSDGDIIFIPFIWNAVYFRLLLRLLRSPIFAGNVKVVIAVLGSDITTIEGRRVAYKRAARSVLSRADMVLCGSQFLLEKLHELCPQVDADVHYWGVDSSLVQSSKTSKPLNGSKHRRKLVRFVAASRLVPVKGVEHLLLSFSLVSDQLDSELSIFGDGPLEAHLRAVSTSMGISHRVRFMGKVSHSEYMNQLPSFDIFVQHNVRAPDGAAEAISGTMLEASLSGLPVAVTDSGGNSEGVIHGVTGFISPAGDAQSFANYMSILIEQPSLRSAMGLAGRRFVSSNFDSVSCDANLLHKLRRLSESKVF